MSEDMNEHTPLLKDDGYQEWLAAKKDNGWVMPNFPRWQTLPIVRFWVGLYFALRLEWWDSHWATMGLASSGYDWWVLFGLKNGWR